MQFYRSSLNRHSIHSIPSIPFNSIHRSISIRPLRLAATHSLIPFIVARSPSLATFSSRSSAAASVPATLFSSRSIASTCSICSQAGKPVQKSTNSPIRLFWSLKVQKCALVQRPSSSFHLSAALVFGRVALCPRLPATNRASGLSATLHRARHSCCSS